MLFTMKRRALGFTLVELMVAVAVMAILIAIAAPSFTSTIKTARVQSQIRDLAAALAYARSEAVSRGHLVTICHSNNATAVAPTCGGTWNDGWIVFVDNAPQGVFDTSTADVLLRVYPGIGTNTMGVFHYNGAAITPDDSVAYNNRGLVSVNGDNTLNVQETFAICDVDNDVRFARSLWVSRVGQTILATANATAVATDTTGAALTCPQ